METDTRILNLITFLRDNKFSDKTTGANTFIRDASNDVRAVGNLHAHIKVTFTDASLTNFTIHATVRLEQDPQVLAQTNDDAAVGRAMWICSNKTYRTPVEFAFWVEDCGVSVEKLEGYCRKLAKKVIRWESDIGWVTAGYQAPYCCPVTDTVDSGRSRRGQQTVTGSVRQQLDRLSKEVF